jgi:UDPglucose 6-dehydrogenase
VDKSDAYIGADFVIIATPTDCDPETNYFHSKVINDLQAFKAKPDIIVANHLADELADVSDKIFTRDLFGSD